MRKVTVKSDMDSSRGVSYFKMHLTLMLIFGISIFPFKNKMFQKMHDTYSMIAIGLFIYLPTILEICHMCGITDDIREFTLTLSYNLTHILGASKTTIILMSKQRLVKLLSTLETGVFAPNPDRGGPNEMELVKAATKYSNTQCVVFLALVFPILLCRVVFAIVQGEIAFEEFDPYTNNVTTVFRRETPFPFWSPNFDISVTPVYQLAFSYQTVYYFLHGFHIGATDSLICGCLMHMKCQFLILKGSLERALNNLELDQDKERELSKVDEMSEETAREVHRRVIDCVKHHQKILELCDTIEEEFKYLMLLQFICSCLIICLGLFQLSVTSVGSFAFVSISLYIVLMTGQIFFYCYPGQQVLSVSDDLSTWIFNCQWPCARPDTRRALLMMMMRCQRPIKFTAGKFTFLVFETFVTIMRASFSYFMVLKQTNGELET